MAKHLFEKCDYELFGIGASLLGFIRNDSLAKEQVKELISDLSELYSCNETVLGKLQEPIQNSKQLFLKYIEYLQK